MSGWEKEALGLAKDSTTQLITLATAITTISVTFIDDILGGESLFEKYLIFLIWISMTLSIIFGVFTLLGLTGMAAQASDESPPHIYASNIKILSSINIFSFAVGMLLVLIWGIFKLVWNN